MDDAGYFILHTNKRYIIFGYPTFSDTTFVYLVKIMTTSLSIILVNFPLQY